MCLSYFTVTISKYLRINWSETQHYIRYEVFVLEYVSLIYIFNVLITKYIWVNKYVYKNILNNFMSKTNQVFSLFLFFVQCFSLFS